jgi:hypothetical protein
MHLKEKLQDDADLRTASVPIQAISSENLFPFSFAPVKESNRDDFYFYLEVEGSGSVQVGEAQGETYLYGALYQDHEAQDAQLAFSLEYDRWTAISGLVREGITWIVYLAAGLFLYVIPGWGLLSLFWPGWDRLHWGGKLGLGGGLSLAIYPVLILWMNLVGLHLGALYAWVPPIAGIAALVWKNRTAMRIAPNALRDWRPHRSLTPLLWPDLALLAILFFLFFTRFWVIRSLDLPLWGDSYQHTLITRLLVDHGGLFDSWQPYTEITSFTYHFGFHSLTAAFHWLTGMPVPQATLWVGQILNGMAAVCLIPLAMRVYPSRWSGVVAVLVAGLLLTMPMFYVNWGRYTQLAAQAMLPAVIFMTWAVLENRDTNWRMIGLTWIAFAGLALTHYRILIIALAFLPAFILLWMRQASLRRMIGRVFYVGIGAGILFLPWFVHVFQGKYLDIFKFQVTTPASQISTYTAQANAIGDLRGYLPAIVWLSLPLIIGWGLWRRERSVALISLWWFFIFLAANPALLNLPGTNSLSNFAVFIAAYFPAALIIGGCAGWTVEFLLNQVENRQTERATGRGLTVTWVNILLVLLVLGLGAWGARLRLRNIEAANYALAMRPDLRAAAWLTQNTPQDARLLVNSFFAYNGAAIVGSDGGWWLPLIAGRQTTLPPLPYIAERGPTPDYRERINALTKEIQDKGIADPTVLDMLRERKVSHVYIGQQHGKVNSSEGGLNLEELLSSPHFRPVYHQDRVWIFEIIP